MLTRSALISALAVASLLAAVTPAHAYCRSTTCTGDCPRDDAGCKTTGEKLQWPRVCVGFSLQKDGSVNIPMDVLRTTVQDSFAAWADIDCGGGDLASIGLAELDDITCHEAEYDKAGPNANAIIVQDTKWDYHGPDDTLAKTTVTFDPKTGQILDADIEINHAYNEITTGDANVVYDLRSILTHEIGHFLGLDHSDDPASTMYADYEPGSTEQRSLEDDDIAGLCDAYPPGRAGVCDATPNGGLADYCKGESPPKDTGGCDIPSSPAAETGNLLGLGVAAALACLRRRRPVRSPR
ncbi:MAG: matrixin family metalloprotease [Polyangiaceae bacterium]